jgi:hypothetical protein
MTSYTLVLWSVTFIEVIGLSTAGTSLPSFLLLVCNIGTELSEVVHVDDFNRFTTLIRGYNDALWITTEVIYIVPL